MTELLDTLWLLVLLLLNLVGQIGLLALHWWVALLWIAWWLWGANWRKAWPVLARGAWVPLVLIVLLAALAWSKILPSEWTILDALTVPNFWWQLAAVSGLVCVALICGWFQGVMGWMPEDVPVDPPAHVEHAHGHH